MSDNGRVSTSTDGLISAARQAAKEGKRGSPPVHLWDPPYCGEIDIVIKRDGTWFHEGTPIGRPGLVNLFASILKREGDKHYLVTPVEKVGIEVEDAPFVAVDFETGPNGIAFVTNVDDRVTAGPEHPIRVDLAQDGEPSPYVEVRRGLEALIDRKSFYRLVEIGEERDGVFGLSSGGAFFPIIAATGLD
ncbi:DUF1285 domain-containing protein [Jannaschia aquimarina]|uniref:DUF1285 domain-containing protein n=1 Tax=Jannaschia aquimarina TaxID=935700 RepID=A0A0D1EH76_9RHOB|nr:DUF1285 domain-containing protein [Jannaschia aquimarina]KIT17029.1 hypothetical protein jaqu_12190 [Jannaschia aquimarina]SNS81820.1 hypothetical protein SAMN05421775_102422 [Jannaschia aquimarina]